jgi:SAM-dependent methyltransferase
MERPDWAPEGIDLDKPSAARMYDYYLGGSHNFAVDREAAAKVIAAIPELPVLAQANRAFLRRAVRYCVDQGIRQFLDIGSGIPTLGNVHEVAQRATPDARVIYVDTDPVAVAHSQVILAGNDRAGVIQEDLRRPKEILTHPQLTGLFNMDEPFVLLMVSVLHFIPDSDDPLGILATFRDAMAPGSHLVIAHATDEGRVEQMQQLASVYRSTRTPTTMRTRAELTALFTGFELVDPGVVWFPQWRPESSDEVDEHPERSAGYVGVGRKT